MSWRILHIVAAILVLLGVADTRAQAPENLKPVPEIAPDFRSDERRFPELGRVGVDIARQRAMLLRDVVEMALENNLDIEVLRKANRAAEFDLRTTDGFFQPRFIGQAYYDRTRTPNVSIFSTNRETTQGTIVGNATVQGFIPRYGTTLSGTLSNQRLTTDNPISILSPQYNAALSFVVNQPLLRGRRFDTNRRTIEIAKRNLELSDTQFRLRSGEVVAAAEKAYWDLTFALRNLQVQRDAVRDARSQLEHNRRLVAEGQLAPIDIVAAETQVANFEQAVYEALNVVNLAENALKNLISPNRNAAIWNEAITPVQPVEVEIPLASLENAVETAIDNRPELDINTAQTRINELDKRLYREQRKPQIDLNASYGTSGIGGSQNPNFSAPFPLPCTVDPTSPACQQQQANLAALTGNPYSGLIANRYPTFRVGVTINLPLFGDKAAEAQYGKALVEAERIETQRDLIEQAIQVEVRNAMQAIRMAEAKLRTAAIARENSVRQYESEQRKLDAGQSDVYKVLERQTALAAARSNELRARIELNKAIAEYHRATGTTLSVNGVEAKIRK